MTETEQNVQIRAIFVHGGRPVRECRIGSSAILKNRSRPILIMLPVFQSCLLFRLDMSQEYQQKLLESLFAALPGISQSTCHRLAAQLLSPPGGKPVKIEPAPL